MTARILILGLVCCAPHLAAKVEDRGACELLHHHSLEDVSGFDFEASRSPSGVIDAEELQVESINFVRLPIFDLSQPDEDRWLYRLANRVHRPTRERALRDALVFREGDRVTRAILKESERVLRRKLYLHDARVLPKRRCGDAIDVDVITRDLWTMSPRLTLARQGGANRLGIGFGDANLLGTGKAIELSYHSSVDRQGYGVSYLDPNVLGSRLRMGVHFTDNDDGDRRYLDLRRPFYSLDARHAWGVTVDLDDRVDDLYFRGSSTGRFRHESRFLEVSGGVSRGRRGGATRRVLFGLSFEAESFALEPGEIAPALLAEDRTLAYPWVGFELVEDAFERTSSFHHIGTTEDVFVGRRARMRVGFSPEPLSGDAPRLVFDARYSDAFWVGEEGFFGYGASLDGHWNRDDSRLENARGSAWAGFRLAQTRRFVLSSSARLVYARGLTEDRQLLLGGDTGLRGYPLRFQAGDRSWLVSLEERYFSDWHLFSMFRIGAAAFVDVGRAWFANDSSRGEYGVLADVGVGLRIESTRTRSGRVHHLDFAFPLQRGDDVDGFQVVLTVRETL